jgi:hypothetical protein
VPKHLPNRRSVKQSRLVELYRDFGDKLADQPATVRQVEDLESQHDPKLSIEQTGHLENRV